MKYRKLLKFLVYFFVYNFTTESFAQCSSVTAKPATPSFPACGTLTALASNGDMSNGVNHGYCASTPVNQNVGNGNSSTTLWVLAGQTIQILNFQSAGGAKIIIQAGGTLELTGNMDNAGEIHVYGTLKFMSATAQHQSTGFLYIATGGLVTATDFKLNGSGRMRIEGTMTTTNFQVQSAPNTRMCINNGGCLQMVNFNGIEYNAFDNDAGVGTVYFTGATCPSGNFDMTSDPSVIVCAPNIPTTSATSGIPTPADCPAPNRFGLATVLYGSKCGPGVTNCSTAVVLPIVLTFFNSDFTSEGVVSKWGISSAWDSDHFIIEKSKNGTDWIQVGTVKSRNSKSYKEYSITDPEHFSGGMYYRLSEVDIKGKITPYSVDFVENNGQLDFFTIYPNPSNGTFMVNVSGDHSSYNFEIVDLAGKSISKYVLQQGQNKIDDQLPAGMYVAKLKVDRDYKIQRLDIQ